MCLKIKNIFFIAFVVFFTGTQCRKTLSAQINPISAKEKINMIADLQTAYFDEIEQPGFVRADQILEEIISARDTSFIALLENVKDSVDVRMSEFPPDMGTHGPNDDKIRNLVRMKYDLSVSLHQLGLFQAGAVGLEEQYELTMEIVNERIDKIPIDVGVQIVFMRENATSFTPFLLQTLDSIEVVDDKKGSMIADILRYSEYQDLDKHIVKRVDRFESEYSVWGRLIHALEGHASEPAVDFLLNKFRTTPDENKKKTMLSVLCEFSKEPINNELVRMIEIVIDENRNLLSSFSRCKN